MNLLDTWCQDGRAFEVKVQRLLAEIEGFSAAEIHHLITHDLYYRSIRKRNQLQTGCAYEFGQIVIHLGEHLRIVPYTALGYMLCGDARNSEHLYHQASPLLEQAADLYASASDEFGWARTVIGRLLCAVEMDRTEVAQACFRQALEIFDEMGDYNRQVRLYQNIAVMYRDQGEYAEAQRTVHAMLKIIKKTPQIDRTEIPQAYLNLGTFYADLGDARRATIYFRGALRAARILDSQTVTHVAQQNIANMLRASGQYGSALLLMNQALLEIPASDQGRRVYPILLQIECYLALNDYKQVVKLARRLLEEMTLPVIFRTLVITALGQAEARQGNDEQAVRHLRHTIELYSGKGLFVHANQAWLTWAEVCLRQTGQPVALDEIEATITFFEARHMEFEASQAHLLMAYALYHSERPTDNCEAIAYHAQATDLAYTYTGSPSQRYEALTLLGHAARLANNYPAAEAYYRQAIGVVDMMQRDLTLLLRPSFLGDKGEAFHSLIGLYIETDQPDKALEAIEQARAQIFLSYLLESETPRWENNDVNRPYLDKLAILRPQLKAAMDSTPSTDKIPSAARRQALEHARKLQEQLAEIIRTLELLNKTSTAHHRIKAAAVTDLQQGLGADKVMVAYYDNGSTLYAFVLDQTHPSRCIALGDSASVKLLIHDLDIQAERATARIGEIPQATNPADLLKNPYLNNKSLRNTFNKVSADLYVRLIKPLASFIENYRQLVIVPYSQLHFLPFHLLYDNEKGAYLIQSHEVVLLPTASLLVQSKVQSLPHRIPGALILCDDWDGRLKYSATNARRIFDLVGGAWHDACQVDGAEVIRSARFQVLHLVAHGSYNRDFPELSFIQLCEHQWMINDLIQQPLRYELVTLTSCESGRLKLTEMQTGLSLGDDLIGLGRAFLYAGAAALLSSRWLVGDGLTLPMLERFYRRLRKGDSKAAAWRCAQRMLLRQHPDLHPVFWGTFQLIGDGGSLSHMITSDS